MCPPAPVTVAQDYLSPVACAQPSAWGPSVSAQTGRGHATFDVPFADPTSSKGEHISLRHTDMQR